jgi:hypothetical protein
MLIKIKKVKIIWLFAKKTPDIFRDPKDWVTRHNSHIRTKIKFLGTFKNLYRFYYFQNDPLITGEGMRGPNSDDWTDTMVLSIVIPLRMLALPFPLL